jgi:hypothetical protein
MVLKEMVLDIWSKISHVVNLHAKKMANLRVYRIGKFYK